MKKKEMYFIAIFTVLGFIALQIPLFKLEGSLAAFTAFDFLAPIAGAFIGLIPGVAAILSVQLVNTVIHGGFVDIGSVIRLFPTLFAVWYFSPRARISQRLVLAVPILAIIAFIVHPVGRTVWYYSLFWLIPGAMYFLRDKLLYARALGATFTAHAAGGAMWIWAFNMPAGFWVSLIPQVAMERAVMAAGIVVAHYAMVNILYVLTEKNKLFKFPFRIEDKYVLKSLR